MPFVEAKCTSCGGILQVDNTRDAWICGYCGTPFIVEKAINNYNITNNITAEVVNIYGSQQSDFVIRGGVLEKYNGESADVVIPDNVTEIGESAFSGLAITSVVIPESVTKICSYAFSHCEKLAEVVIPKSVQVIENQAFGSCSGLKSVVLNGGENICIDAFCECFDLASLTISGAVKTLNGFRSTGLESVNIPDGVEEIGSGCFWYCSKLKSVSISRSVKTIGGAAFSNCKSLTSITIPEGVTTIVNQVFEYCENLTSIKLPGTINKIEHGAFAGCYKLTDIDYPNLKRDAKEFYAYSALKKGLCPHCNGKLGLLTKKCKKCGRYYS